jgi:hypothetical protein
VLLVASTTPRGGCWEDSAGYLPLLQQMDAGYGIPLAVYYQGRCLTSLPAPVDAPLLRARGGARPMTDQNTPRT